MLFSHRQVAFAILFLLVLVSCTGCAHEPTVWSPIMPEQRTIQVRDPSELPKARIPDLPPPNTVSDPQPFLPERPLSLDEAIRIALANSEVVRVLAGTTAVSSGRTIYDPAISNTIIDQEQARFDPRLDVFNRFDRTEPPQADFDPLGPVGTRITGIRTDGYNLDVGLAKTLVTGGEVSVTFTDNLARFQPGVFPLNPKNSFSTTLNLEQPLLQGASVRANLAPIVVARINTERSFFQLKDALQESVRGVIEAYWALVFARTDVWARQQQVKQGEVAYNFANTDFLIGPKLTSGADVAQAKLALANFKSNLVAAEANLIQREAALRNILGLPPSSGTRLLPISPMTTHRMDVKWDELVRLAEQRRPDLIELKLIIEADQQLLIRANNQALPKVDAVALYRWNGLEGRTPARAHISADAGQFTDWTLGVNFSLPLGLRQGRAALRQQQLIVARDWANLDQGLHSAIHDLASSTRRLAQFYEQYRAITEARKAAYENLEFQAAVFRTGGKQKGQTPYLNLLLAIADWGNAVSAQARTLADYNTELATLEFETGTILETHGIFFFEERYESIGPLGRLARPKFYPESMPPSPNIDVYPTMSEPAENIFDLKDPLKEEEKKPKEKGDG